MAEGKRVAPMKVGPGAYLAMAKMYKDKATLVRGGFITTEERSRVAQMLEDAARDYEATAKEMAGMADA